MKNPSQNRLVTFNKDNDPVDQKLQKKLGSYIKLKEKYEKFL